MCVSGFHSETANDKNVSWAFMDLKKGYDRVDREAMWDVLYL